MKPHGPFSRDALSCETECVQCGDWFSDADLRLRPISSFANCRGRRLTSVGRFEYRAPTEVLVANRAARMAARGMRR